jgi:hypothetical protein
MTEDGLRDLGTQIGHLRFNVLLVGLPELEGLELQEVL